MADELTSFSYSDFLIDGSEVSFNRSPRGSLIMQCKGKTYTAFKIRRAFPLEIGETMIGLFEIDGSEIGMLETLDGMDEKSVTELRIELNNIYFQPRIIAFNDLDEEFGILRGEIETTNGPRHLEIRGYRENVRLLSGQRAIIEDVDGNRYLIEDWPSLPQRIREILGL